MSDGLCTIRAWILGGKIVIEASVYVEGLDTEWMQMILEAKQLGIDKEEIKEFLNRNKSDRY